jgi:Zn-dependent alcohol dehydrogenase
LQVGVDFLSTAQNKFPFHKMITHQFPLEKITEAMRMADSGKAMRIAILP